jgi:SAM-dependent methyltransferase
VEKPAKDAGWMPLWARGLLPDDKNSRILDIGCGYGNFLHSVKILGYDESSGIDICPQTVDECQNRALNVSLISSLEDYCDNYSGERFAFILMSHVLEHLNKNCVINILNLIKDKLLADDGKLLICVPNAQSSTGCYWAYEDFTHETLFTAGSLIYVLKAAGFSSVEIIDADCLCGLRRRDKYLKKILLFLYRKKVNLWNWVTGSSFHRPSPQVFS